MRLMIMGPVSAGKTTLCQYLAGLPLAYGKTQTVEIIGSAIDTPGEYTENHRFQNRLLVTSADADMILLAQDCTAELSYFSPGQASMFAVPAAAVITKTELAPPGGLERARKMLDLAGASPVFAVSAFTGAGMAALTAFLAAFNAK
jgi:ethanolamine utilization protein EutP